MAGPSPAEMTLFGFKGDSRKHGKRRRVFKMNKININPVGEPGVVSGVFGCCFFSDGNKMKMIIEHSRALYQVLFPVTAYILCFKPKERGILAKLTHNASIRLSSLLLIRCSSIKQCFSMGRLLTLKEIQKHGNREMIQMERM